MNNFHRGFYLNISQHLYDFYKGQLFLDLPVY